MNKKTVLRVLLYTIGMITLALGVILATKADLGVSAIISVAYTISTIWNLNFGNVSFIWYSLFVLSQLIIHHFIVPKEQRMQSVIKDVLQLPVCLIWTRFMNLFSAVLPDLHGSFWVRFVVMLLGIVLTGIGAAMTLDMRLAPNPADGIVQAISDVWGKSVGFVKNCYDAFCVCLTIAIGLIFVHRVISVGIGTVICVIGVGRVIALFNRLFLKKLNKATGL